LQGAWLQNANLQAADLDRAFVWRAKSPGRGDSEEIWGKPEIAAKSNGLGCPPPGEICRWTPDSYAALKGLIENAVPLPARLVAYSRIAVREKPPDTADDNLARMWVAISNANITPVDYALALATTLQTEFCAAESSPAAIAGLIRQADDPFAEAHWKAGLTVALLDDATCPAARGLREEERAKLWEIRHRAKVPPDDAAPSR
jgi:hypothetical protein